MGTKIIQDGTLTDIADAIRAKTGKAATMTPLEMPEEIESIESGGGTEVENGVIWKTLDADGNPTEVDFYGSIVPSYCFGFNGYGSTNNPLNHVQKINWKTPITTIMTCAFSRSNLTTLIVPETVTAVGYTAAYFAGRSNNLVSVDWLSRYRLDYYAFTSCTALERFYAPNISKILNASSANSYGAFYNCTSLENVELGSIGSAITLIHNTTFANCTQTGLTITIYTTANYVDTLVTNVRNGATNATIIIKASEETTYNGTTYSAGDTILTNEVTS